MAKTQKKRNKAYKPRDVRLNVTALLFDCDAPLSLASRLTLLIEVHWAAMSLTRGVAENDDWFTVVNAINAAKLMCEKSGNSQVMQHALNASHNALIDIGERANNTGLYRLGVGHLTRINDGLVIYEQLIEGVTKRMHTAAINEIDRRLKVGDNIKMKGEGTQRFAMAA